MRYYTAHLHPARAPILVREGFSWPAAIFGPFWLFSHRAWLVGIMVLGGQLALAALPARFALLGGFAAAWLLGLFGQDLRRFALGLRGYAMPHVIAARDGDAAQARLLGARPELMDRLF